MKKIMKNLKKLLKKRILRSLWVLALIASGAGSYSQAASVTAAWTAVTQDANSQSLQDLTRYSVYYATFSFQSGGVWLSTTSASTRPNVTKVNVGASLASNTTSYLINTLTGGSGYYFRLTATNSVGESGFNVNGGGGDTQASTYDVSKDGSVNAIDVQSIVNQSLGVSSCAMPDPNLDTACNALDVQKVVNVSLGL